MASPNTTAIERAFQIARSGEVEHMGELDRQLSREGYNVYAGQLSGDALRKQLSGLIRVARMAKAGPKLE